MKGNMFCASQASTATANDECITTARAIDRHNPIIKDARRSFTAPCSSGDDYVAPYRQISKVTRVLSSSSSSEGKIIQRKNESGSLLKSFGCVTVTKTPPGSTRYLLGSDPVSLPGSKRQDEVVIEEGEASEPKRGSDSVGGQEEEEEKKMSSGSDKVVVIRVSLHCNCRGCQDKVKKHLSKMQGVRSFNVDFVSKKVTVTGDITPLEVLSCLSKVKSAQFWTQPPSSLPSSNLEN